MKRSWNELDDKYIIENANILTWTEISKYLGCSISTVQNRAQKLGVKIKHFNEDRWTKDKDDYIRKNANIISWNKMAKYLECSPSAVRSRTKELGIEIKRVKVSLWNDEKDQYILDNVFNLPWKDMAKHLNCSITTVQKRAEKIGVEITYTARNRWTKEEIDLLRELAPKYLGKTIAKKLNKSYTAIKKKAIEENIEIKYKPNKWKKWMIYYLKDNIDKQSIRQIAMFLELNDYQVRKKCDELGLNYTNNRWTKDEEQILKENFSKCHYSELTKLLPNKSKSAILCKARNMNLNVITEATYFEEEVANYIIKNWGKISINEMARTLKVSRSRIYLYKKKYNLPNLGQKIKWDEKTINELRTLALTTSIKDLAKHFKTTPNSIKTVASKNNIKLINSRIIWTEDKIERIKELSPYHTINEMCEIFNVSYNAMNTLIHRLKLNYKEDITRNWTDKETELLINLVNKNVPIYEIMKLIDKTDSSIINKCKELNLSYIEIPKREWTIEEIEELKKDAKSMNIKMLVIKYKRSSGSITAKLNKYHIRPVSIVDYWSIEDVEKLKQYYEEGKSIIEIASLLNRSNIAIELKLKYEGIDINKIKNMWTKEEEIYLEDNWDIHTVSYLAKKLHRTRSSIINKAHKLNLSKQLLHPEALKISEISEIFNVSRHEIDTTWMILGLPYKVQKISDVSSYKYVDIDDLFNFLENNQFLYDGKDFEENILGPEPQWVKIKRKHDYFEGFNNSMLKLKKKQLLQEKKYYLEQIKEQENVKKLKK